MNTFIFNIFLLITILITPKISKSAGYDGEYSQNYEVTTTRRALLNLRENRRSDDGKGISEGLKLIGDIAKELQIPAEFQYSTKKFLKEQSAIKLAKVLSVSRSSLQREEFHVIYRNIIKHFEPGTVDDILRTAIESVYNTKSAEVLFEDLCAIWQCADNYQFTVDRKHLEPMVNSQIMLYALYQKKFQPNYEYIKRLALLLNRIRKSPFYGNLKQNLKYAITSTTDTFPDNLKYLLFKPYFCMMNVEYNEFIYTAVEAHVNSYTRYVWLWHEKYSIDNTGHIQAEVIDKDDGSNPNDVKITLRGTLYDLYLYLLPDANGMVGGLLPWKAAFNHIWDIQFFEDDKIFLKQNDTIMCSQLRHDDDRRLVNSFRVGDEFNRNNQICQWSIGACNRN